MVCSGYPTVSWRVGSPEKTLSTCASLGHSLIPFDKKNPRLRTSGVWFWHAWDLLPKPRLRYGKINSSFFWWFSGKSGLGWFFFSEAYSNLGCCAYFVKKSKWAIDDFCCPLVKWRANEHGEGWAPTRKKSQGVLYIERLGTLCRDIFFCGEPDIFWDDLFSCVNLLKRQFQCILSMLCLGKLGQFLVQMLWSHGQEKSCVCLTIGTPRTPGHSERMNPFSELFLRK